MVYYAGVKMIDCPAGKWTTLTRSMAAGMPASYPVRLEGEEVAGTYRVYRSYLPFGIGFGEPETGELGRHMEFARGWFDASFKVEIKPESDITAKI